VVPPRPGIFSAVGLASSDVKYDFIRTIERPLDRVGAGGVAAILAELGQEAAARLAARLPAEVEVETRRTARLRYMMQDNKVELPLPEGPIDEAAVAALVAEFHEAHRFQFGHNNPEGRIELVSLGVEAFGRLGRGDLPRHSATAPEEPARRQVHFRQTGWTEVPVLRRVTLSPGSAFVGPAIVEEREATIIVTPGVSAEVDAHGNLVLTRDLTGEPA
jgi:N-methylhydantoinase A